MEGKKTNKNTKMKNFKHGQNFGGNTNVNRVQFLGIQVLFSISFKGEVVQFSCEFMTSKNEAFSKNPINP